MCVWACGRVWSEGPCERKEGRRARRRKISRRRCRVTRHTPRPDAGVSKPVGTRGMHGPKRDTAHSVRGRSRLAHIPKTHAQDVASMSDGGKGRKVSRLLPRGIASPRENFKVSDRVNTPRRRSSTATRNRRRRHRSRRPPSTDARTSDWTARFRVRSLSPSDDRFRGAGSAAKATRFSRPKPQPKHVSPVTEELPRALCPLRR